MAMKKFGIFSPVLGKREDFPSILLNKAFQPDHNLVQAWNGELRSAKMRGKELIRETLPIVETSGDAETISIAGDYTAIFSTGDDVVIYDSDENDGTWEVTERTFDSPNTILTLSGDVAVRFLSICG